MNYFIRAARRTKFALRRTYNACRKEVNALFSVQIKPGILKQTLLEHKIVCACFALAFIGCVSGLFIFSFSTTEPARYEYTTSGREIDFTNPKTKVHTAEDGVAVIDLPIITYTDILPGLVPTAARFTTDPATIWQNENTPTHNGFTLPVQMDGESIGVLTIPNISLSVRVYEADDTMEAMTKGAAHFKSTSAWAGNVGLSAHNINMDGSPGHFLNIHKLKPGAVIRYETALGKREYKVEIVKEISEMDWSMLYRTEDNRITLITCITGKPDMRLVVQAAEK